MREEAKYPESESGLAAVDGTHSHTLLEQCVPGLLDPTTFIGKTLKDHDGEFTVDAARAARVKVAIDYLIARRAELGNCTMVSEHRVNPAYLLGREDLAGTADIQIHGDEVWEIADYKDGMNPVPITTPQLELYALGMLAALKIPVNLTYPMKKVRLTIIQPKLAFKGLPAVQWRELDVAEILGRIAFFSVAATATDNPAAALVPGESQCKYCKAKGNCSALAVNVMKGIGMTSIVDLAQQSADLDTNSMSNERLREIVEAAPLVRQLLESAEEEALNRAKSGQHIPGLKLVYGRGSKAWSLPEEEMAEKLTAMGIPKASVYITKLVSPAQAVKLTWEKRDGTKKQLSERQLKTLDTEYIVKMAGKLTIAPESDSRPAVVVDAAPLFAAVEPELPAWLK